MLRKPGEWFRTRDSAGTTQVRRFTIRRLARGLLTASLLVLLGPLPAVPQVPGNAAPKRILVLMPLEGTRPAAVEILRGIETGLARTFKGRVSVVTEFTRTVPPEPPDFQQRLPEWISYKYGGHKFDLLCPIRPQGLVLAERLRERLWPGTPIVFGMTKNEYLGLGKPGPGVTGIYQGLSDEETVRSALGILPETRFIALVGGSASIDRQINSAISAFVRQSYPSIDLIDLTGLTIEEGADRVSTLPDKAIVYQGSFSHDSSGRTITTGEMSALLGRTANRPLFGNSLLGFGSGPVGGPMNSIERGGEFLGMLAGRVLRGESPDKVAAQDVPPLVAVDWRQLEKWDIPESRIPAGAEVRFRSPTLWEQHRFTILATAAALLLQSILIGILLVERRRRRVSEGAAVDSEDLNRAVLSSLSGRIAILDQSGTVIRVSENWNSKGPEYFAIPPVDVGGSYIESLGAVSGPDGGHQGVAAAVSGVLSGEGPLGVGEYHARNGEGDFWCEVRVERLARKEGGAVVTHLDVTPQKKAELERRRTLDELHHMNRVASVGQLAGALAHELAQPLTSILSNAQAAERFAAGPAPNYSEIREALAEITADDRRARTIIDRMRAILKKQTVPVQVIDLNQIANEVSRLVRSTALTRRIALAVELHPEPVLVHGDVVPLQQVLLNLLNNGMDAAAQAPAGARFLKVQTKVFDGRGGLIVEDTGPGFREEDKQRLFESFHTTKPDGLGMGLSICRTIVEALGGQIAGENRTGGGAVFRVELPLATGLRSSSDSSQ